MENWVKSKLIELSSKEFVYPKQNVHKTALKKWQKSNIVYNIYLFMKDWRNLSQKLLNDHTSETNNTSYCKTYLVDTADLEDDTKPTEQRNVELGQV